MVSKTFIKMKNFLGFLLFVYLASLSINTGTILPQSAQSTHLTYEKSIAEEPPENNYKILGLSFINGYMIPHAKEVLNVRGANPRGYEANIFWHLNNNDVWNDCHCYPRIGVFISFYDFDLTDILGYGIASGINYSYFFGIPKDYNFHIKGKAGFAYLTKPFDKENHPQNMSYSTHFNYILSIGGGITLKPWDNIEFQIDGSMNHQSNAALLEPNGGINYWAASISANYFLEEPDFQIRNIPDPYLTSEKKRRWDFSFSWGISSMPYPMPGQVPMYGVTIARSWQVWRVLAFTVGTELERNGRAVEITRREKPGTTVDPFRASILSGVEFLMGRAIFSVQLGGYFHRPFVEKDDLYQRWGLVYNIFDNLYAGINFKSYRNSADHLSLRVTISL